MSKRTPCIPWDDEPRTYKTVGLARCKKCQTMSCWAQYLAWEKAMGITLNKSEHPPGPPQTQAEFYTEWWDAST